MRCEGPGATTNQAKTALQRPPHAVERLDSFTNAQPQHSRRPPRRKKPDPLEGKIERRFVDLCPKRVLELLLEPRISFAEEEERQMDPIGPYPRRLHPPIRSRRADEIRSIWSRVAGSTSTATNSRFTQ